MPGSRHSGYYEVLEALAEGGCPVCGLAERSVRQRLASLSYEQVNDPAVRDELRAAQGFCRRHAWQFLELGGTVLGAAIIYADILRSVRRRLPTWRARRRGDGSSGLLGGLLGRGRRRVPRCVRGPHGRAALTDADRYAEAAGAATDLAERGPPDAPASTAQCPAACLTGVQQRQRPG